MMQILIKDIADLSSGIYVNAVAAKGRSVFYLQMRHWNKEKTWAKNVEPELQEQERLCKYYLNSGDVLLVTKGWDHSAVLYNGQYSPAVASSVFTVLRIRNADIIMPEYLQWYLNHPATAKKLATEAKGTAMPLVAREVIEQLMIPVPTLQKQRAIVHADQLQQKATQLRARIEKLNEDIFYQTLLQTVNR